jgi:hypothetical protein
MLSSLSIKSKVRGSKVFIISSPEVVRSLQPVEKLF